MSQIDEEVCEDIYNMAIKEIKICGKKFENIDKALIRGNNVYYVIDNKYNPEIFLVIGSKGILDIFPNMKNTYIQEGIYKLIASLSMNEKEEILKRHFHIKSPMIVTRNIKTNIEHFVYRRDVYSSYEIYEILH